MIIKGNTVSTGKPRADYAQTDEAKSDFIRNKPDAAISKAQQTADAAKTTAEAALPKAGGAMTGDIAMGGNKVTGIGDPEDAADAAHKGYVDGKRKVFSVTLTTNDWVGDAAPYTQTIGIEGILSTDMPHYGPVFSDDAETALSEKENWALVDDLDTADGSVTFTCFEDKPEINIVVQMEVHR